MATPPHNFNNSQLSDEFTSRAFWIHSQAGYHQTDRELHRRAGRKIGAIALAIYDNICSYANFQTGMACPSIATIAEDLSLSHPTVIKFIALLERCNMLQKEQTRWGSQDQGPKARNFYKVLRSTLWDFSSVKIKVKAVRKKKEADVNDVYSNKNHIRDDNHESQKSSSKVQAAPSDVNVISSTSDEGTPPQTQKLAETLISKGFAPDVHAYAYAQQAPDICRDALDQLSKARIPKREVGAWLRSVIVRQMNAQGRTPDGFEPSEADLANQREAEEKKMGRKKPRSEDSPHGIPPVPAPAPVRRVETPVEPEPKPITLSLEKRAQTPEVAALAQSWDDERAKEEVRLREGEALDALFRQLPDDIQFSITQHCLRAVPGTGDVASKARREARREMIRSNREAVDEWLNPQTNAAVEAALTSTEGESA